MITLPQLWDWESEIENKVANQNGIEESEESDDQSGHEDDETETEKEDESCKENINR